MGKFAKNVDPDAVAAKQAANVMKQIQGSVLKSVGTVRNYEERLTIVAKTVNELPFHPPTNGYLEFYVERVAGQNNTIAGTV